MNRTRRFRRCVNGNCIGFESLTLHAAVSPLILDIGPPADPPINLVTAKKEIKCVCYQTIFPFMGEKYYPFAQWHLEEPSNDHHHLLVIFMTS